MSTSRRRRPASLDVDPSSPSGPLSPSTSAGFFSPVSTAPRSSPIRGSRPGHSGSSEFLPSMGSLSSLAHSMVSVSPHRRKAMKRAKSQSLLNTRTPPRFFGKSQPTAARTGGTAWAHATRPGPASYRPASSMGTKMSDSMRSNAPRTTFSKGPKPSYVDRSDTPGVGAYDTYTPSMGRQSASNRRSAPSASFGTSFRSAASRMYAAWAQ